MASTILKIIDRLIKAGYPEGTAKKIATGELDMSLSARNARMREQGYNPSDVTYHYGPKGIQEFKLPNDGRGYKFGPGVYSSPRPEYGERYLSARGISPEDAQVYQLVSGGKIADKDIINDLHYEAMDRGGSTQSKDFWGGMQEALKERGYTGLDLLGERNVFDPVNVRDVDRAAFDPDNIGKPNILGGAAPVAAGGILSALALAPEDAEAGAFSSAFKMADDALQRGNSLFTEKALERAARDSSGNSRSTVTVMSPDEFLRVVPTPENSIRQDNVDKIVEHIRSGGKLDDVPFLTVGMDKDMNMPRYTGHEGRHRALALKKLGINEMPVRIKMGDEMGVRWDQLHSGNPLTRKSLPQQILHEGKGNVGSDFPIKKTPTGFETARGVAATGGLLASLGLPEDATAADIATAGMTVGDKEEARAEVQQMILDALLGFMAPTPLGDATMDAYNQRKNQ